jgi:hypothetical protein
VNRVLIGAVTVSALALASGCSSGPELKDVSFELTGDSDATANVTRTLPDETGTGGGDTHVAKFDAVKLPWKSNVRQDKSTVVLVGTPTKGALTCRITVAGQEVAKKTGAPGQPVTCTGAVPE